jgi:lipopolysaccharide export system protein LptA
MRKRSEKRSGRLALHLGLAGMLLAALVGGAAMGAAAQGALTGSGKTNTDQPIEIDADRLDVHQNKQLAIFSGNVDAVQGAMRLRADSLQVHYRPKGGGAAASTPGIPGGAGAISQIDAVGRVKVTSPEETAQGDRGVYFVDRRMIVLEGNVTLTRSGNVLKGQRATMNFDSGRAVMDQGRVRGVFSPDQSTKPKP